MWIPPWLSTVGSAEEIVEWKAISRSYRGRDLYERRLEFVRRMRERHPDMPLSFEEELAAGAERLRKDPALRRAQGLDPIESRMKEVES